MSNSIPENQTSKKTTIKKINYKRALGVTLFLLTLALFFLSILIPRLINSDYIKNKAIRLIDPELKSHITADLIRPIIFPRPGLECSGLRYQIYKDSALVTETAMFFPDLSVLFSKTQKALSGELVLKQTRLERHAEAGQPPIPFKTVQKASIENVAINFSYVSTTAFSLNIQGRGLKAALTGDAAQRIAAPRFQGNIIKTAKTTTLTLTPTAFNPPAVTIGINFHRDESTKTVLLTFTGQNIAVEPVRKITTNMLKGNKIVDALFHIVKGGSIPELSIDFSGNDFLFDPRKMVLHATLEQGIIGIPKTRLTVRDVAAAVTVKDGILSPRITSGVVKKARLKKGTLAVDLLDRHHRFNGNFDLTADLAALPDVLIDLLPGTLLARELAQTEKIRGRAAGTLVLNRSDQGLNVEVRLRDIHVAGRYLRFPGRKFDLNADSFSCDNKKITLAGLTGAVGEGHLSNLSGKFDHVIVPYLEISTAGGDIPLQTLLPWLNRFAALTPRVAPWLSGRGHMILTHGRFKGPLLQPEQWRYRAVGTLDKGIWGEPSGKKSITDLSTEFEISPNHVRIQKIEAKINAIPEVLQKQKWILSHERVRSLLSDLRLPLLLHNATLQKKGETLSAKGELTTPAGIVATVDAGMTKGRSILNDFTLMDPPRSRASLAWNGSPPINFSGTLDMKTVKNLFQPDTDTAAALNMSGITGDVQLKGAEKKGVSLLLEQVSIVPHHAGTSDKDGTGSPPNAAISSAMSRYTGLMKPFSIVKKFLPGPLNVRINTLDLSSRVFSPVIFSITTDTDAVDVALQKANLCKNIPISGRFQKKTNKAAVITLAAELRDREFSPIIECLTGKSHLIEGRFDFKGTLFAGHPTTGKKEMRPPPGGGRFQFKGPFELIARDGRFYQMTLLSRILSLINVSSLFKARLPDLAQHGFAYERMICKGKVENNRILIEKGVINGVDMTLVLTGWMDPLQQTMELLCFISPLKTVDSIVQKLPIINTMFKGDIISIPFTVKGDMHKPEVLVMTPAQVTKGLFNTLKDILTTPLTLLEKLP